MAEELKIRIRNYKKTEDKLLKLGAKFIQEFRVVDTYFNQPSGVVLKIIKDDRGDFLVKLKSNDGKFKIVKYEKISNVDELQQGLTAKHGVKCVLRKKRRLFKFGDYSISINLIKKVGEFLIVEGGRVKPEFITKTLGINKPEYITVSFDELKLRKETK